MSLEWLEWPNDVETAAVLKKNRKRQRRHSLTMRPKIGCLIRMRKRALNVFQNRRQKLPGFGDFS